MPETTEAILRWINRSATNKRRMLAARRRRPRLISRKVPQPLLLYPGDPPRDFPKTIQDHFNMNRIKIGTGDWIVVCDGRKALILENRGDRMFPNLHTREVHEQPDPSTHALGSDAPGRVHQSTGDARRSI